MDKYQLIIEQKKKELDELEREKFSIDTDYSSVEFSKNQLNGKIYRIEREIFDLERTKREVQGAPKYFKKKKIMRLLSSVLGLLFALGIIGIMNISKNGGFVLTLSNVISAGIGVSMAGIPLYFADTHKKRKEIKGINLNDVEEQLNEKEKEKKQYEQEYELSESKLETISYKRNNKQKEIEIIQKELSELEDTRRKAINQILDSLLEQSLSVEDSISQDYKPFIITKPKEKSWN